MGKLALSIFGRVWLSGESDEAILVNVDCKWLEAGHKHVESQIILEASEQVRFHDVLIDHVGSLLRQTAVLI